MNKRTVIITKRLVRKFFKARSEHKVDKLYNKYFANRTDLVLDLRDYYRTKYHSQYKYLTLLSQEITAARVTGSSIPFVPPKANRRKKILRYMIDMNYINTVEKYMTLNDILSVVFALLLDGFICIAAEALSTGLTVIPPQMDALTLPKYEKFAQHGVANVVDYIQTYKDKDPNLQFMDGLIEDYIKECATIPKEEIKKRKA